MNAAPLSIGAGGVTISLSPSRVNVAAWSPTLTSVTERP